jgi:hypothetical protein
MRSFALIAVLSTILACKGDRPESAPASAPGAWVVAEPMDFKTSGLVPPPDDKKYPIVVQTDLPAIEGMFYVQSAGELLLSYEASPYFNTADDRLIFDQMKGYASQRLRFNLTTVAVPVDQDGNLFAMAYSCAEDRYYLPAGLRMSKTVFAMMLYHEISHAAFCAAEIERRGLTRGVDDAEIAKIDAGATPCMREYRSYAASVRAFLAFHGDRSTAVVIGGPKDLNVASIDTTMLSWRALSEDRFCTWYAAAFPDRYP